jgi:hypothetical protein
VHIAADRTFKNTVANMRAARVASLCCAVGVAAAFVPSPMGTSTCLGCSSLRSAGSSAAAQLRMVQHTLSGKPIGGALQPISNAILVRVKNKAGSTVGGVVLMESSVER